MLKNLLSKGNTRSLTVKKNILGSLFIKGISIIVSMMLVPMTLGYVSSEIYGIWLTLSSVMVWMSFFDVGFTLGLKNRLAEAIARQDWEDGKALVSTTYFMMLVVFMPILIIGELLIPYIDWPVFLNVSSIYNQEIIDSIRVMLACFCAHMIVGVLTSVISAFQKVALSSLFPVIGNVLSLGAVFLCRLTCPPSLVILAVVISLMPIVVVSIASIYLYYTRFNLVSPSLKYVKQEKIKGLFNLGAKFFLIQIQSVILYQTTNILISNVAGPSEVTVYNIAYKYLGVAMMVFNIILGPLWPAFTDAYVKRDYAWMNFTYKKMQRAYLVSIIVLSLMVVFSQFVYSLWIGDLEIIPWSMTIIVAFYMALHNWDQLQVYLINGIGAIKLQTFVTMFGLISHVPMSLFFGHYFGAIGVTMSMIVVNIVYASFFTTQIRRLIANTATGIWKK